MARKKAVVKKGVEVKKKIPDWAVLVGIVGIIVALSGIVNSVNTLMLPKLIDFKENVAAPLIAEVKEEIRSEMSKELEKEKVEAKKRGESMPDIKAETIIGMMEKLVDVPRWYKTWFVITGLIGLGLAGFYLYAASALLQIKKRSANMFIGVLIASIVFGLIKAVAGVYTLSILGFLTMGVALMAVAINTVLLIVVLASNKEVYA